MASNFRYTPEMLDFLREGYKRMCLADLTVAFNQAFGTNKPLGAIRGATRNHRIKSGRSGHFEKGHIPPNAGKKGWKAGGRSIETQFKKGRPPQESRNYKPIGSTRISKDGYLERKVTDDPNLVPARRWIAEHRLRWEAANGEIPKGHVVVFLDGDKRNLSLHNLRCVHRGVLQYMNKNGLNETAGEARKAAIFIAEVVTRAKQLERKSS